MWRNRVLSLTGVICLVIAGCASEESPPPQTTAASPSPAPTSPTLVAPANTKDGSPTNQPADTQLQNQPAVPGLIPSTNSQERGKQVTTEIRTGKPSDPFAGLPPVLPRPTNQTVPNVSQLPAGTGPNAANTPRQPVEAEAPTIPKNQDSPLGVRLPPILPPLVGTGPSSPGRGSSPTATRPTLPLPPPPPSTDTAKAVEVTGVVVVGRNPQAIVVAPGDATSRYVSPGQRVSGGKVLVKRIEFPTGSEPVVILEENGVEVAKSVGEKPPQAETKPAA